MTEIIIPIYNQEKYIQSIFGSLLTQTKRKGFIATFVDDCSTDNSVKLIEEWIDKVPFPCRILRVQHNTGCPGLTRQYGLDHPTAAEYVMFLDGDDILLPNAVEELSNNIQKTNSNFISSIFYCEHKDKQYKEMDGLTWLHGKIYRRSFLDKYNIRFFSGYNEDASFNQLCVFYNLLDKKDYIVLKNPTYIWTCNPKSITHSQRDFITDNAEDIVINFSKSYEQLWSNEKIFNEKITNELMMDSIFHLKMFYNIVNNTYYYKSKEEIQQLYSKIIKFCQAARIYDIEWTDKIKHHFVYSLTDEKTIITVSMIDYLKRIGLNIDLRPIKEIEESE